MGGSAQFAGVWDDDRVAGLIRCINDGLSVTDTGRKLGLTRGQVAAKAARLGLKFAGEQPAFANPDRAARAAAPKPERAPREIVRMRDAWARPRNVAVRPEPKPAAVPPEQISPADYRLLQNIGAAVLSPHTSCQWIPGDPKLDATKCGAACVAGLSYCAPHALRSFDMARLRAIGGRPPYIPGVTAPKGNLASKGRAA